MRKADFIMENKLHFLNIKTELGTTSFWVQKQNDGKYHFQMDSCETELKRKELRALVFTIEQALSEG